MVLYRDLYCVHKDYSARAIDEITSLYKGGHAFDKDIKLFLPRMENEGDFSYAERLSNSSYVNHLSNIIAVIKNFLFENKVSVLFNTTDERYLELSENISTVIEKLAIDSLLYGRSFVYVKDSQDKINSLYDLNQLDLPCLESIDVRNVINWKLNNEGELDSCLIRFIKCVNTELIGNHDEKYDEFYYWHKSDGKVKCDVYQSKLYKTDEDSNTRNMFNTGRSFIATDRTVVSNLMTEECTLVDSIIFETDCLPIISFNISNDLNIGSKIAGLLIEATRRRSKLIKAESNSLCAIPTLFLGPEISDNALYDDANNDGHKNQSPKNIWNDRGYITLTDKDDFKFVEPENKNLEISAKNQEDLVDEIYKICFLSSLTNKAIGKKQNSGVSKEIDMATLRVATSYLATQLKTLIVDIIKAIEELRFVKLDYIITGLDLQSDVETIEDVEKQFNIISKMQNVPQSLYKSFLNKVAGIILKQSAPTELMQKITKEIDAIKIEVDDKEDDSKDNSNKNDESNNNIES